MQSAERENATPWDFRMRAFVFGLIYALGFFIGIQVQYNLYHSYAPGYVLLGARFGAGTVHALAIFAALLALGGFLIRVWGSSYLSSGIVWSEAVRTGQLRVAGPYRYVRNPLYLGNILLAAGISLLGPPVSTLIIVAGNLLFVYRLIAIEERGLARAQGSAYEEYRRLVPRLWPRLSPAPLAASAQPPSLLDGISGEIFGTGLVLAMLYNAVYSWRSPNLAALSWVFFAGFLLQAVLRLAWRPAMRSAGP
jgi:protein-S-isoprenylcysteine O-methyltransferase Ste14